MIHKNNTMDTVQKEILRYKVDLVVNIILNFLIIIVCGIVAVMWAIYGDLTIAMLGLMWVIYGIMMLWYSFFRYKNKMKIYIGVHKKETHNK